HLGGHRPRGSYSTNCCGGGVHGLDSSIPVVGDDGTATSRRGILPARYACLPDSTACFIAVAIRTGSCAAAIPVFIRIPSTPCSITMQASDAVPTPASTITGTESLCLMVRIAYGLSMPSPDPIGEARGMTATAPASSSL